MRSLANLTVLFLVLSVVNSAQAEVVLTKNRTVEWHKKWLGNKITKLTYENGLVLSEWHTGPSSPQEKVLREGDVIFKDFGHHSAKTYRLKTVEVDGIVIEYEDRFDHTSFGTDKIDIDQGTFKMEWKEGYIYPEGALTLKIVTNEEIPKIFAGGYGGISFQLLFKNTTDDFLWFSYGKPSLFFPIIKNLSTGEERSGNTEFTYDGPVQPYRQTLQPGGTVTIASTHVRVHAPDDGEQRQGYYWELQPGQYEVHYELWFQKIFDNDWSGKLISDTVTVEIIDPRKAQKDEQADE